MEFFLPPALGQALGAEGRGWGSGGLSRGGAVSLSWDHAAQGWTPSRFWLSGCPSMAPSSDLPSPTAPCSSCLRGC